MTSAIVLAAGESSRMGRPKALLAWSGETLLEFQVRTLLAAGVHDVVVVLGADAEELRPRVSPRARVVVNEAFREGRASSLRAGAAALPDDADPVLIVNVDQPRQRELIEELVEEHIACGKLITIPAVQGKRGHPVVVAGALLRELREASDEEQGLRGVIAAHEDGVCELELPAPIVLLDINTPEDYGEALRLFGVPSPQGLLD